MSERELHCWVDFDDSGKRRVRIMACESKAVRQLLKDKRFRRDDEYDTERSSQRISGSWSGGAFPFPKFFPANFRGRGDAEDSQREFVTEERQSVRPRSIDDSLEGAHESRR